MSSSARRSTIPVDTSSSWISVLARDMANPMSAWSRRSSISASTWAPVESMSACLDCDVRFACHGGCPRNRFTTTPDGEEGLNYLCPSYKAFFKHVDPAMKHMSCLLKQNRAPSKIVKLGVPKAESQGRSVFASPTEWGRREHPAGWAERSGGGCLLRELLDPGLPVSYRASSSLCHLPGRPLCDRTPVRPRLPHFVRETKTVFASPTEWGRREHRPDGRSGAEGALGG